jgi:hypothetical protein
MLGVFGVIALVLGGFTAGGGAFDWEFLFSDGYREHGWVRSFSRDGARGLLILLGSVLGVAGFVMQVVDTASKPVPAVAAAPSEPLAALDGEPSSSSESERPSWPSKKSSTSGKTTAAPSVAGPNVGKNATAAGMSSTDGETSSDEDDSGLSPVPPGPQPITIWNPQLEPQENQTLLILQYRFVRGHRPQPGSRYHWVVNLLSGTNEIEYEANSLEKQGQLTQLFDTPRAGGGFDQEWSTQLEIETDGRRAPVSNLLEITSEGIKSKPLKIP